MVLLKYSSRASKSGKLPNIHSYNLHLSRKEGKYLRRETITEISLIFRALRVLIENRDVPIPLISYNAYTSSTGTGQSHLSWNCAQMAALIFRSLRFTRRVPTENQCSMFWQVTSAEPSTVLSILSEHKIIDFWYNQLILGRLISVCVTSNNLKMKVEFKTMEEPEVV